MSSLPPALLTYAVTPTSVPEGETVTLELAVANATGAYVPCEQIVFTLPTTGTEALTTDPGAISAAPVSGTSWSIVGDGAGNFTATPTGQAGLGKTASIAFLLAGVPIVAKEGLSPLGVVETSGDPAQARAPGVPPAVERTKQGLAITTFTAAPIAVCPGSQVLLAWATTGAQHCTLYSPGSSVPVGTSDSGYPVYPEVPTTYTLEADGGGHAVRQDIPVAVLEPQIVSFAANPLDVGAAGNASTLTWLIVDADSAVIEPVVGDVDPNGGSFVVNPTQPTLYSLQATGCGATHSATAYVNVDPVQIVSFTGPASLFVGDSGTLAWQTTAATGVSIDQGVGTFGPNGDAPVAPGQTTTYTLSAEGYKPEQSTVTVPVVPIFTQLTCELSVVIEFSIVICMVGVNWATIGASGVLINGQAYPASGSQQFGPSSDTPPTLGFVAQGAATSATASLSVGFDPSGSFEMDELVYGMSLQPVAGGLNAPGQVADVNIDTSNVANFEAQLVNSDGAQYSPPPGITGFSFPVGSGQAGVACWNAAVQGWSQWGMTATISANFP